MKHCLSCLTYYIYNWRIHPKPKSQYSKLLTITARMGSGAAGAVASKCDLGSILAQCHIWVKFVVRSSFAWRVFLRVLRFSSLHKTQHLQLRIQPGYRTHVKTNLGWSGFLSCDIIVNCLLSLAGLCPCVLGQTFVVSSYQTGLLGFWLTTTNHLWSGANFLM